MENTKKRPNAYAMLFSFFKSKAVRNIVSAALLICSLFTMLIIDKENHFRKEYFSFLDNEKVTKFFDFFKIEHFNVTFMAWIIFAALFIAGVVLLVGNIFSGSVIKALASRYSSKPNGKGAKVLFGIIYYILLLVVAAVIILIFFMAGNLGNLKADSSGVFLNLLYTLLIMLAIVIAIFLAVIIAYTLFLLALAVLGFAVYQIAKFAKALDTDGSVFGSNVQVVTVATETKSAPEEIKTVEEDTEEVKEAEVTTEETTEEVDEETEKTIEVAEEAAEVTEEVEEVTEEVVEETEKTVEVTEETEKVEEVIEEESTEETVEKAAITIEENDEETDTDASDDFKFSGNASRLKTSFLCRLIQAEKETADYYSQLKNYLLSYKGVNSRTSWFFDSFNKGRNHCAKLNIRGKTVIMYIALDPKDYSISKYHHTDVSDKAKYVKTPMMLRVRSARALKYAFELISIWMEKNGVKQTELKNIDYTLPYETNEALLERGLIKKV